MIRGGELVRRNPWEHVPDNVGAASETDGERMLACAVLERAIMDADPRAYAPTLTHGDRNGLNTTRRVEREKAQLFLTATTGTWARQRNFWVNLAGIDPDAFTEGLAKRLASGRSYTRKTGVHGIQPL
jgi:hypothetical protein